MKTKNHFRKTVFIAGLTALCAMRTEAGSGVWNATGGGDWSDSANWSGGSVAGGSGATASFTSNLGAAATITNDVAVNVIGSLVFADAASTYYGWTLAGPNALTMQTSNGSPFISVTNADSTINLRLAGSQGFTKTGAAGLTLSGANTYDGPTIVTEGTLTFQGDQSAASGGLLIGTNNNTAATVNVSAGATISAATGSQISVGNVIASGVQTATLNIAGNVTNNGTFLAGRASAVSLNSGAIWNQNNSMVLAAQGGYSANLTVNKNAVFAYAGANAIALNPASANSGSATLTVAGGVFSTGQAFANNIASSTGSGNIVLSGGGTLKLSANIPVLTGTAGSPNTFQLGAGGGVIDTAGFATTMNDAIGGSGSLTKAGAGTLTLNGVTSYTGTTTISNGTLALSGSIATSPMIVVAATNAVLQLAQSVALTNNALLVVNAGGMVALNGGVNQTIGALCLGGQWVSDGTWGSSASAAANKNDDYFSSAGIITVAQASQAQTFTPSFISSYRVRYYQGSYDNVNPAPGVIAYMPFPGWDYVPTSSADINSYNYQSGNGWPVAAFFIEDTAPVGDNTNMNGSYMRSNSVADTVAYFTTNTSPTMPLNYMLSDFEPYDQTLAHCELEITNMVNLVRASSNTNVSGAFVGNYACYAGGTDSALTPSSRIGTDAFYRSSGLNVAQPNAYPYASYTNNGPNARSGLFWSDLELVSFAKINLPAGHKLIPWLDNSLAGDPAGVPPVADCVALMAHIRLRGADGFCDLGGLINLTYGWTDLDWLFHGAGSSQILNLATDEASGFQWSGFRMGANLAFMFSNLGTSAGAVNLPNFPGLPEATPSIPAGTHMAWYFVNDPAAIATNDINLGRDGIDHALFVNGTFTLTNTIQVVQDTDAVPAAVTIGNYFTNDFSTRFAGPLVLSNNVTLQSYCQDLTFAGLISGDSGVTTLGNIVFAGADSYGGGTTIASGTLCISNAGALGSGVVTIPKSGTKSGTLQLALTGNSFVLNNFNGFNSTTFTGDSTVPDIENVSGNNTLLSGLTVTGTGGNGIAVRSDTGLLELAGTITTTLTYRELELNGAGNGLIAGDVVDGSGTIAFGLIKDGTGTWTLSGANSYSGSTIINNGTLLVNGSTGGSAVTVASGATLAGDGIINGPLTVNGTLAPGNSTGTLTLETAPVLNGTTLMEINLTNSPAMMDKLVLSSGILPYGGTLTVTNTGPALTNGSTFKLFAAPGYNGNFAVTNLPPLNPPLAWTNRLALDGTLAVISTVNPTPTNLVAAFDGMNFDLSWPSDHLGWRLETQTNALSSGLGTNWFTWPSSTNVTSVSIPVNLTNAAVFFRLIYP